MLEIAAIAKSCKVEIAAPKAATFLEVAYRLGPQIVMLPSFAFTVEQIKQRIKEGGKIQITDRFVSAAAATEAVVLITNKLFNTLLNKLFSVIFLLFFAKFSPFLVINFSGLH